MGFKLPGKSITSGTASHSSALKMRESENAASALKQMELTKEETKDAYTVSGGQDITFNPTGTEFTRGDKTRKVNPKGKTHKKLLEARWKKGDKASGNTLNELVSARKKHKKGSAKYAAIQNKINESLGSKKVHTATKTTRSGETKVVKPKGTTTRKSDDKTVVKGLGAQKGKTLEYTRKVAEKERISKERQDITGAKTSGDKVEKAQSQKEISEIKSGRDDAKTGTVLSRAWHKARAKRKARKEERLTEKNA